MKKWFQKIKDPIPVICWGLCLVIWLFGGVLSAARDFVAKSTGSLYEFSLSAEDFALANLHMQPDGSYLTETDDPQMHWQNTDGITLRSLRMKASFSSEPREMCLYYATEPGEPFGVDKRVFASQQNDGSYLYALPAGKIAALRLDPCSPDADKPVTIEFEPFEVNESVPLWQHFAPGWAGFFKMLLYPGLAAAALSLVREGWMWYKSKRKP